MSTSVSTHVLDTGAGRPAAGVRVELYREGALIGSGTTDADGRIAQLGTELEPGRCADLAVWRTDGLELAGANDLVAGLVFALPQRVHRLYVGGEEVVRDGHLVRADEAEIAREHRVQAARLWGAA